MPLASGKIHQGDCIGLMQKIEAGSVDLVFADPPFNIGYEYDQYDDRQDDQKYLDWCRDWIKEVYRILKPSGTFWLAIGDEYAAELKVAAQREIGFTTRSWVIWYYTFGVNCKNKFSRSHAHLFHFVKNPKKFTFNAEDPNIRVPSARALVYGDKRANPDGRLPDDTWILRPQDFQSDRYGFNADQDTWYFSRVAGTFKERQGFHGCQMPEQLLARIIRASSNKGDLVLDPFSGSGTTLAVAKKLGREFRGCELSSDYVKYATERLKKIKRGDSLDGPADPVASAPSTANGVRLSSDGQRIQSKKSLVPAKTFLSPKSNRVSTQKGIQEAFLATHEGFSSDRLLADPHLNEAFLCKCKEIGIPGEPSDFNRLLIRLRKSGKLKTKFAPRSVTIPNAEIDLYSFAAEIAWKLVRVKFKDISLDEILCDPAKIKLFDEIAKDFSPGFKPVEYRWAALRIRKQRKTGFHKAIAAAPMFAADRFSHAVPVDDIDIDDITKMPGLYLIKDAKKKDLYLGETLDLGLRIQNHKRAWHHDAAPEHISILPKEEKFLVKGKTCFVTKRSPCLNLDLSVVKS